MKDYRLTVKVRNNRILKAFEECGFKVGWKWCKQNDVCYSSLNSLIRMTSSPLYADGRLTTTAQKICDVLNKLPEDLWSNEQLYPLEKNFSEIEMDYGQICALMNNGGSYLQDFSGVENDETRALIDKALSKLTEKQQKVIRMKFYDEMSNTEIASELKLSLTRVAQIESSAFRKIKNHHEFSAPLMACL